MSKLELLNRIYDALQGYNIDCNRVLGEVIIDPALHRRSARVDGPCHA